jgi:antitoxin VapB
MKTAAVITEPGGQVVRLPEDCRLEGDEVFVQKVGPSLVLIPKNADPWQPLVASLDLFSDDFMADRAEPAAQYRESAFP